ncbi:MAG: iron-containing alcohol dehydrogenase [Pirellulaceae bacterium]|nr:iron-containing alcohol dehydrogenase [Pirellulaceae bacterium]
MQPFDFQLRTRLIFGPGSLNQIASAIAPLKGRRVLLITDPGVREVGYPNVAAGLLEEAGYTTQIFDGAGENPTTEHVEAGVVVAREFRPEILVGIGGGSSMDCAKGINFIYSCGGRMQDYWGVNLATAEMLPMIAVPTTSGTGSEMQSFALISDAETHVKMACGDKRASFAAAILDPSLTLTQPALVTAVTGIDALSHAVETYVSKRRTQVSQLFSRESWRLLSSNFAKVLNEPQDLEARGAMQLGAAWAGLAIENSMLGAAHSLANPLTARYDTIHGQAVGISLPHVVRFNGEEYNDWYSELLQVSEGNGASPPASAGATGLAEFLTGLVERAGLATRLSECGIEESAVPEMAKEAAQQWTAQFNPRRVSEIELRNLYEQAF